MGLFDSNKLVNALMGNASELSAETLQNEFGPILCADERIEKAYSVIRDRWVFTNKRLILQDIQGLTGKKREYMSIPYKSVERFSVETAGNFDMDSDLKIWFRGASEPITYKIGKDIDIFQLQIVLANHVL